MLKFSTFITEAADGKNTHLEHIEDLVFNEGVAGTRKAINFLRDLRDMLAGHSNRPINITTKWDGAPAIFAGIDPEDGQFFVAKKGLFNKVPQMFKSVSDVKKDTKLPEALRSKFITAYQEFKKLNIKTGVYQGDLMFTKEDLNVEEIDGKKYLTFQPNTIIYAVPIESTLARNIRRSKIGVVWHTTYTGTSIADMSASFGKSIVNKMQSVPSVWMDDAVYKDVSGNVTMTRSETQQVTSMLSHIGKLFNKTSAAAMNEIGRNDELLIRVKAFNNSKIRAGKSVTNVRKHVTELQTYVKMYYDKEADKRSSDAGKQKVYDKYNQFMVFFNKYKQDLVNIFELVIRLAAVKQVIVEKLNRASSMNTFLRTRSGFRVTEQEGYVAVDHLGGNAIKLVDRLEFSMANFSPDVIKGWSL